MIKNSVFTFIGLFLIFNFSLYPSSANAPRMTDILSVLLFGFLLLEFFRRGITRREVAIYFIIVAVVLPWLLISLAISDSSLTFAAARLLLTSFGAAMLVKALFRQRTETAFLMGGCVGGLIVTLIAVGQYLDLSPAFDIFIPAETPVWWGGQGKPRSVGIWQHPNGLAQAQMVSAAFALALAFFKRKWVFGLASFAIIVLGTYYSTQTRSMIVVAAALIALCILFTPHRRLRWLSVFVFAVALPVVMLTAESVLGERWFGTTRSGMSLMGNISERLETSLYSLGLILQNPLGYGFNGRREVLIDHFGFAASHNSYISLGLTFALPALVALIASIWLSARSMLVRDWQERAFLPVLMSVAILFLVEDSIYSTTMQFSLFVSVFAGLLIKDQKAFVHASTAPDFRVRVS